MQKDLDPDPPEYRYMTRKHSRITRINLYVPNGSVRNIYAQLLFFPLTGLVAFSTLVQARGALPTKNDAISCALRLVLGSWNTNRVEVKSETILCENQQQLLLK